MRIWWINSSEARTQTAAGGNLFRSLELELCTAARSVEKADFKPHPNQTDQHRNSIGFSFEVPLFAKELQLSKNLSREDLVGKFIWLKRFKQVENWLQVVR